MEFKVTSISRGDIHLTDGVCNVRVLGEGLIPPTKNSVNFVVYLNSFYVFSHEWSEKIVDVELRSRIINSIKKYFEERGEIVEFE